MGSVKDLILGDSSAGKLYIAPTADVFGRGAWKVSGRFSVGDLKGLIPPVEIANKAQAITMMTGAFFEYLASTNSHLGTCYMGVMDSDGKVTTVDELLKKGDTTDTIVMRLAHTPDSYCKSLGMNGANLAKYREAMQKGTLRCGVADVESIFRKGFPLGSSFFKGVFKATGRGDVYESLSTYQETVVALDEIRFEVEKCNRAGKKLPKLEAILQSVGLREIPNPGFVLKDFTFDSTTKFEVGGDRVITKDEERLLSGLGEEGYAHWTQTMFPAVAKAQIDFCEARGVLNIDGKCETVAYRGHPVLTDFACTVDENRLMILLNRPDGVWAIPSNKEIQRAIFRKEGIYSAIEAAKLVAERSGNKDEWRNYLPTLLEDRQIDIRAVSEHSCNLMAYAISEVANRILGKRVFDAKPLDVWVPEFMPYASKIEYQK